MRQNHLAAGLSTRTHGAAKASSQQGVKKREEDRREGNKKQKKGMTGQEGKGTERKETCSITSGDIDAPECREYTSDYRVFDMLT